MAIRENIQKASKIAVLALKGGCGKTTIVSNLSYCFARMGYKTLAIDTDPNFKLHVANRNFIQTDYLEKYNDGTADAHLSLLDLIKDHNSYSQIVESCRKKIKKNAKRGKTALTNEVLEERLKEMMKERKATTLKDIIVPSREYNLDFVFGSKKPVEEENSYLNPKNLDFVFNEIKRINGEYNFVMLDCPAGDLNIAYRAVSASDLTLMIDEPDPQTQDDSYDAPQKIFDMRLNEALSKEKLGKLAEYFKVDKIHSKNYKEIEKKCEQELYEITKLKNKSCLLPKEEKKLSQEETMLWYINKIPDIKNWAATSIVLNKSVDVNDSSTYIKNLKECLEDLGFTVFNYKGNILSLEDKGSKFYKIRNDQVPYLSANPPFGLSKNIFAYLGRGVKSILGMKGLNDEFYELAKSISTKRIIEEK